MFSAKFRLTFYMFLSVILILGGCNVSDQTTVSSVNGDRRSKSVFSRAKKYDPVEAHMRARRLVDPNDTRSTHEYTKKELPSEYLGPDTQYVMRDKPPPEAREKAPWYSGMRVFDTASDEEREAIADEAAADIASYEDAEEMPYVPPAEPEEQAKAVYKRTVPGTLAVTNVRVGEHPGKTRLVLDMTAESEFDFEMEDDKNLLVVNLPEANWEAQAKKVFATHPLILAYIAKPAPDGGSVLAIKLRKKARVVFKTTFKPSGNSGHRIVFDIAAS